LFTVTVLNSQEAIHFNIAFLYVTGRNNLECY